MDKYAERRKFFKTPPVGSRRTQEERRAQVLEEQKRKRSQQVDAFRRLDQFSGLSLNDSDEEVEEDASPDIKTSIASLSQYTLTPELNDADLPPASRTPSPLIGDALMHEQPKSRGKGKGRRNKPTKWANKCMYAELLEVREDSLCTESFDIGEAPMHDGLPDDLETAWVGLAPVPVGKRCLAVTMQSAGESGLAANTILRSRLMGKVILRPFPAPLPPNTILDCILDENWKSNGILHVLDVVRWKGQDVAGCEASFRFWWRDTRLAEVPVWAPPAPHKSSLSKSGNASRESTVGYVYPFPTTLVPVPYVAPLSFEVILNDLLERARHGHSLGLKLPFLANSPSQKEEIKVDFSSGQTLTGRIRAGVEFQEVQVPIASDGLLLYVGEAAYESGETPLSVWVPRTSRTTARNGSAQSESTQVCSGEGQSPLDTFERLVRRRLVVRRAADVVDSKGHTDNMQEVDMSA